MFYCVREHSEELIEKLRFVLNCREDFDRIKHIISEKAEIGDVQRAAQGTGVRFYLALKDVPGRVIGSVALNNIVRGAFQSCFLGYKLDGALCGRGYMTQAVEACTRFAFGPAALHRVEANVLPRNTASLRVLEKCGYRPEGLARRYLRINGAWEDHIHMVRLNEPDKG